MSELELLVVSEEELKSTPPEEIMSISKLLINFCVVIVSMIPFKNFIENSNLLS